MKPSDNYHKWVEWSEEDQAYLCGKWCKWTITAKLRLSTGQLDKSPPGFYDVKPGGILASDKACEVGYCRHPRILTPRSRWTIGS